LLLLIIMLLLVLLYGLQDSSMMGVQLKQQRRQALTRRL
jgi:hypothetical protein